MADMTANIWNNAIINSVLEKSMRKRRKISNGYSKNFVPKHRIGYAITEGAITKSAINPIIQTIETI